MKSTKLLILYSFILFLYGCNPIKLPGLRELAKKEDERIYTFTKETIAKSPELQDLDKFCKELPLVKDFILLQMSISDNRRLLFYHYYSSQNYENVKSIYIQKLTDDGWRITEENNSWGPKMIEFVNDNHWLRLNYQDSDSPEDDWNYAIDCGLRN